MQICFQIALLVAKVYIEVGYLVLGAAENAVLAAWEALD